VGCAEGQTRIQCRFDNETIWLTQALISELFQVTVPTVNEHLKGIFDDGELATEATIRKFRIVRTEGARQVTRDLEHYSREQADAVAQREYESFEARRRGRVEDEAELDTLKQLEDQIKKLPKAKKPKRPKP
jgi:hypothetical protein